MNYSFYDTICEQPDLQDVATYLQKPIQILENIHAKIIKLNLKDKTNVECMEINLNCDKIINKHLPNLIDNYCDLTLEYRNTVIIKKEEYQSKTIEYTAKQLLLKNLKKITEEINIIHNRFNELYSHVFLAHTRIISQLGNKPVIINTNHQVEPELVNQFDYSSFTQSYKNIPVTKIEPIVSKSLIEIKKSKFSFLETLLVLGFIMLIGVAFTKSYEHAKTTNDAALFAMKTMDIQEGVYQLYQAQNNYKGINKKIISQSNRSLFQSQENMPILNWNVSPTTTNKKDDSALITFTEINQQNCHSFVRQALKYSYDTEHTKISVNYVNVSKDNINSALTSCETSNRADITLIK